MDPSRKNETQSYEIVVDGQLDTAWGEWFDGFTVSPRPDGTTILSGPVSDQSALHGTLEKMRDLNLEIISIRRK